MSDALLCKQPAECKRPAENVGNAIIEPYRSKLINRNGEVIGRLPDF
jgi:hypothetical protein